MASNPYPPSSPPVARPAPIVKVPAARASPAEKTPTGDKQVTVKTGDTAGKIAALNKLAGVSLDQMLVALLRSNPDAFIGGNANRIKSGAVLDIPNAEAASAISAGEATQTIIAQSRDFNAFRRKLAEGAPTTQVTSADRQTGGKVQAKIEDRASASAAPDKLTLSQGAVQGKAAAEDKIARDRQVKDASTRMAELSKNISDLNKLGAVPATNPTSAPATNAATAPNLAVPAPSLIATPTPAPAAVASAAPSDAAAVGLASKASAEVAPAVVVAKQPLVTTPKPQPEPGLIDELLQSPLLLAGAGVLLALLASLGFYRYRQRNRAAQVDSSFLESRLQPDSFFGASGGQRIDTNEANITGSSMVYSPSVLDAAGDVDPVAEADVYLAYGRDLQAEEILKEALRTSPLRVAIHAKLLEIYAKRRDSKAFDAVAREAFNLTGGHGPEWAYIIEMGRELNPTNPMYAPGGQPVGGNHADGAAKSNPSGTGVRAASKGQPAPAASLAPSVDIDLDLDFSSGDGPNAATFQSTVPATSSIIPTEAFVPTVAMMASPTSSDLDTDFSSTTLTSPEASAPALASKPGETFLPEIAFPSDAPSLTPESRITPKPALPTQAAAGPAPTNSGMMEFDLGSLSLDLNGPTIESPAHASTGKSDDPLETKFLLAEEFRTLGDAEGARALVEEVVSGASGPLKVKAQAFLNALS
jgi:pilus assembly protein FimV